jgi:RNA polymerase sigma factor (sigma-70 family)
MLYPQEERMRLLHRGLFQRESDLTALIERCRVGDSAAWEILVDRFADFVYSVAKRYRLNSDDADDVFQQTFQALHQSLNRIENPETLPKWLAVTASRLSLKTVRIQQRTTPLQSGDADLTEVLEAEDASAEASALQACESEELHLALVKLGGKYQSLLHLLYLTEDSSYQAVSDSLGIPIGAIGPTRARCLEKLRKILVEGGFF